MLLLLLDTHREAQQRGTECLQGGDQGPVAKLPHIHSKTQQIPQDKSLYNYTRKDGRNELSLL